MCTHATWLSPGNTPSAKTITALITVSLFVLTNNCTQDWKPFQVFHNGTVNYRCTIQMANNYRHFRVVWIFWHHLHLHFCVCLQQHKEPYNSQKSKSSESGQSFGMLSHGVALLQFSSKVHPQFWEKSQKPKKCKKSQIYPFWAMSRTPPNYLGHKFGMPGCSIVITRYIQSFIKILLVVFEKLEVFQKVGIGKKSNSSQQ